MNWADGFVAVDWGTTNRRAYRIDPDGRCGDEFSDGCGVLSVEKEGFPAAVEELRARFGALPLLLGGMVGSNRGWVEASYVPCPAGLEELSQALVPTPDGSAVIVPGLACTGARADVMRGEEVQLLGAVASGDIPEDCLVCHPGTHNKWSTVRGGKILAFRTVMTGEVFSLLKRHSIFSDLLQGEAIPGRAFGEGVSSGLSGVGLTSELFGARARVLLGKADRADIPSFISGLLIGEDVRIGLREVDGEQGPVVVMGRSDLTSLYSAALKQAGVDSHQVSGDRSFIAGATRIVELIK
jgi:2-dehydro-3-deoxygalactonokinase